MVGGLVLRDAVLDLAGLGGFDGQGEARAGQKENGQTHVGLSGVGCCRMRPAAYVLDGRL